MRKALLLFAVLGLAGSLWAADPIIGTWKLNVAKSDMSAIAPGLPPPKQETVVYREVGDNLIEMSDGLLTSNKWTWPRQGGIAKREPPLPEQMLYIETLVEPGHWFATILRNGKQTNFYKKTIDKDRKTMRQTFNGVDSQGKPFERLFVYEKQ